MQTNAGNYTAAITVFDGVLSSEDLPDPHAAELKLQAYLGRGTVREMHATSDTRAQPLLVDHAMYGLLRPPSR
jgi:hypothetical protein